MGKKYIAIQTRFSMLNICTLDLVKLYYISKKRPPHGPKVPKYE